MNARSVEVYPAINIPFNGRVIMNIALIDLASARFTKIVLYPRPQYCFFNKKGIIDSPGIKPIDAPNDIPTSDK